MRISLLPSAAAAAISLLGATLAHALPLKGKVINHQGDPVASAYVMAKKSGKITTTDAAGNFNLELEPPVSLLLKPGHADPQIKSGRLSFNVVEREAKVRISLRDLKGRLAGEVFAGNLSRGRYSLSPLAGMTGKLPAGAYTVKLEVGGQAYHRQVRHAGRAAVPGLRFEALSMQVLAKMAGLGVDTLLASKAGFQGATREIVVVPDSLPDLILYPYGYTKGSLTDDQPYLLAKAAGVTLQPLLTVGEAVKRTGNAAESFRMAGLPDGMGAYDAGDGTLRLFVNHEARNTAVTHALHGSARNGSYVSEYVLSRPDAGVISGNFAYTSVHLGDGTADTAGVFNRFCSGSMAGPGEGLTENIYLAGEETSTGGFGGKGGEAVAIVGGKARLLPDFGRMAYENLIVAPVNDASSTVVFALEDGPTDSCQLYMYVGAKDGASAGVLGKNGLTGGKMYAFKASDTARKDESSNATGTLAGSWVEIAGVAAKTAARLEEDSRAAGAFIFDRIEDGAYDRNQKGVLYFVTTGGTSRNPHGRLYKLGFDAANPAGGSASIEVLKTGGPGSFVAPDNIDINADGQIMVQEDPTDSSYFHVRAEKRNSSIWSYDVKTKAMSRLAEINEQAVPPAYRNSANAWWESSGIIDASAWFGRGTWILDVQAHSVLDPNAGNLQGLSADQKFVEGGQILLLRAPLPAVPALGSFTDDPAYLKPLKAGIQVKPLFSVGESVPRTSNLAETYRMIGLPDGLGAFEAADGTVRVMMNHEARNTAASTAVGAAAKAGSFITQFVLSKPDAGVLSADYGYGAVHVADGTADSAGAFNRFCSGSMAGPEEGLTENIYFAGEETGVGGYGGKGGEAVAVAGGKARLVPDLGRMAFENIIVAPVNSAATTVAFSLEDGAADSCQLYMYIGTKDGSASSLLAKNGLTGGKMYVFKANDTAVKREASFTTGALPGAWVEIPGVPAKTAAQLEADSRAAGALSFDRIEDGTYDRNSKGTFYFVTTGGTSRNPHGRLYKLAFNPADPAGGAASLEVLKTGGPGAFLAPDNIDINSEGQIMIQEDPTDSSFFHLRAEKRNASIWMYDVKSKALSRILEIDETAVPGYVRNATNAWWETSGIIDASAWFGRGAWLLDVQSHSILDPNAGAIQGHGSDVKLLEGGQLILVKVKTEAFGAAGRRTDDAPYIRSVNPAANFVPMLTVGEDVPRTTSLSSPFRMIGILDGMGANDAGAGKVNLFLNHELAFDVTSHPLPLGAAKRGAYVSLYSLAKDDLGVVSGDFAYTSAGAGTSAADSAGNFSRFCSGNLSGPEVGMSDPIYFTGEERGVMAGSFSGKGGEAVAIHGGRAHLLPDMGRMAFENVVVAPVDSARYTVAFSLEDGPVDSCQLYMYVGLKDGSASHILERNGLVGGKLYAFKSSDTARMNEGGFTTGSLSGTWVEIAGAAGLTAPQLETASRAVGAFAFDRVEDGTYDRVQKGRFWFVSTGSSDRNPCGRLYRLDYSAADPAGGAVTLTLAKNGGPGSFCSPDNLDLNADGEMIVQEDPTDKAPAILTADAREASVWLYKTGDGSLSRLGEMNQSAVPAAMRVKYDWESSGVIDVSSIWGKGYWLMDVQASSVNEAGAALLQGHGPGVKLVRGGQLLLMKLK